MMVGHLDGETFQGVVELPLKENYANAIYGWAWFHWVIGIPSIIILLILVVRESKKEFITSCFYSVPIFLMSMGFTIQYMVLLIKVNAEFLWWSYVVATVIGFIIANVWIYFDRSKLHPVLIGLGGLLVILCWFILVVADSAVGHYIITSRNKLQGSFSVKTMVGTFQTMGIMIFLLMYGFVLKLRFGGEE